MGSILIFLAIVGLVLSICFAVFIASGMNKAVDECLRIKRLSRELLCGTVELGCISDSDLFSLREAKFTHVGVVGVGPIYLPSYEILEIIGNELSRRRE